MKDRNTIIILDIVLIVVAVALAIFLAVLVGQNKNESENKKSEINNYASDFDFTTEDVFVNVDDTLMFEYANSDLNIKFKHYNDLTRTSETTEKDLMYQGVARYTEDGNEGISLLIGSVSKETTLESYIIANVNAIMEANELSKKEIVVIKDNVKFGNVDAYKVRYKMDGLNIYQMATIKDGKEYVVMYSAEDGFFDKQRAENMFSTFEFIN